MFFGDFALFEEAAPYGAMSDRAPPGLGVLPVCTEYFVNAPGFADPQLSHRGSRTTSGGGVRRHAECQWAIDAVPESILSMKRIICPKLRALRFVWWVLRPWPNRVSAPPIWRHSETFARREPSQSAQRCTVDPATSRGGPMEVNVPPWSASVPRRETAWLLRGDC